VTILLDPLLTLSQWLSPAFPTGGFAYSHGLEQVVADGVVHDAASAERWLAGVLRHGAGRQDAVLLLRALAPGADHAALDALARALAPSAERVTETLEQGAALARTVAHVTGRPLVPRALPVALGEAAAPLGLQGSVVVALFLQAFAGNLVTIAIRHVPLGQSEGQAVLGRLGPVIAALAGDLARDPAPELAGAALAADLAAMRHETSPVRLFRT
jgi:urease accessory protein